MTWIISDYDPSFCNYRICCATCARFCSITEQRVNDYLPDRAWQCQYCGSLGDLPNRSHFLNFRAGINVNEYYEGTFVDYLAVIGETTINEISSSNSNLTNILQNPTKTYPTKTNTIQFF